MITLARDFYVVTSPDLAKIPAVLFFISYITKACYLCALFQLKTAHMALPASNFNHPVFQHQFSDCTTGAVTLAGCGSVCTSTLTSTRRFNSRPWESVFDASGWVEP
jgi:hypothetical protein